LCRHSTSLGSFVEQFEDCDGDGLGLNRTSHIAWALAGSDHFPAWLSLPPRDSMCFILAAFSAPALAAVAVPVARAGAAPLMTEERVPAAGV